MKSTTVEAPPTAVTRWRLRRPLLGAEQAGALAGAWGLPLRVVQLLHARGVESLEAVSAFVDPPLSALHDPHLLAGMDRAVDRIARAIGSGEQITVYGDYDVDGVTSTAALVSFLGAVGARVDAYIPHRLAEGYGLNLQAVERIAQAGTRLLITCDCGVTAVEEVDRAVALGVEVIVIDHHRVPAELPRAAAILNPYQPGCEFPFRHLAAVGVTFKLMMALRRHLRESGAFEGRPEPNLRAYLDLVALGTVADVVPLVDENRVLVQHGLSELARAQRLGVRELKAVAEIPPGPVSAGQVGFRLGPRINAAGRLDDARAGLELLCTDDPDRARTLAQLLDDANAVRRRIEDQVLGAALSQAAERATTARGLVLAGEGWHRGVVGIVASRVVERFHRPTVVLELEGEVARGSARSVDGFHLHDALASLSGHLTRFGGHRAAAGLELPRVGLEAFRQAFAEVCAEHLGEADLCPVLEVDAEVELEEVDEALAAGLERLAPFGMGNPTPVLLLRGVRVEGPRLVGRGPRALHLKGRIGGIDCIGFGLGEWIDVCRSGAVDVACSLGFDEWQGRRRLQLRLREIGVAGDRTLEPPVTRDDDPGWGHVHLSAGRRSG